MDKEYLLKPMGDLYFSDTQYTLKFDLNLDSYYSNAKLLHLNTLKLEEKCTQKNNSILYDCTYFHENLRNVSNQALREVNYIKSSVKTNRDKREIILALALCGTAIFAAVTAFIAGMAVASSIQKDLVDQSNLQHNVTQKQFEADEKFLKMNNKSTNVLAAGMHQATDAQYINQLLFSFLLALDKHHRDTNKYFNILNGDLKSEFFKIIDISTFQETIQSIEFKEIRNSPVFSLKAQDLIKMSILEAEHLNDTIRINVHIPLTSKEKLKLYVFTPIPIRKDGNTFILNSNSKYIVRNKTVDVEIPATVLAMCTQFSKLTICDEIPSYGLLPIDDCLNALISNRNAHTLCTYRSLPHKNQIIEISKELLYVYITNPMAVKVSCGKDQTIYNLTQSAELNFDKHCRISTKWNRFAQNESFAVVKIDSGHSEPNFSALEGAAWQNLEFLNQHNIEIKELTHEVNDSHNYFQENSKILKHPDFDLLSLMPNFIFAELIKSILLYVVLPVTIVILISCCLCRYIK